MRKGEIIQCFLNVNMGSSHDGLTKLAKDHGVKTQDLAPGEYLVFVNSARDRVKVYAANNTIAYYRAEKRGSIDLRVIQMIPRAFNAHGKLNYDEALKLAVEKALLDRKSKGIKAFVSGR